MSNQDREIRLTDIPSELRNLREEAERWRAKWAQDTTELPDRHELPDDLWRCDACGRFASRYYNFVDHSRRGCPERKSDAGLDGCGCEPEAFCSEACADRWHGGRSR